MVPCLIGHVHNCFFEADENLTAEANPVIHVKARQNDSSPRRAAPRRAGPGRARGRRLSAQSSATSAARRCRAVYIRARPWPRPQFAFPRSRRTTKMPSEVEFILSVPAPAARHPYPCCSLADAERRSGGAAAASRQQEEEEARQLECRGEADTVKKKFVNLRQSTGRKFILRHFS